jgi:ADP-heptose:LPS heptosyltransferase
VVKQWQPGHFAEVAQALESETSARIVLTGGPGDAQACAEVEALLPGCINLCSKITLPQVMGLVAGATLLVTNDSAPQHMAAMVGTPTVCVTGANHYGWWHPYPSWLAPWIITVYPRQISQSGFTHEYLCSLYGPGSTITVHEVEVRDVLEACRQALKAPLPAGI